MPHDKSKTRRVSEHERQTIRDRAATNQLDVSEHICRAATSHGVATPVLPVLEAEFETEVVQEALLRRL